MVKPSEKLERNSTDEEEEVPPTAKNKRTGKEEEEEEEAPTPTANNKRKTKDDDVNDVIDVDDDKVIRAARRRKPKRFNPDEVTSNTTRKQSRLKSPPPKASKVNNNTEVEEVITEEVRQPAGLRRSARRLPAPIIKMENQLGGTFQCPACKGAVLASEKGCNVLTCRSGGNHNNNNNRFFYFCCHCKKECPDGYAVCQCPKRNDKTARAEAQTQRNQHAKSNPVELLDDDSSSSENEQHLPPGADIDDNDDNENVDIEDWANNTVAKAVLRRDAVTLVIMPDDFFEEYISVEGFGDYFQELCLFLEKGQEKEDIKWFRTCGTGPGGHSNSYQKVITMLLDEEVVRDKTWSLYVLSGDIGRWGEEDSFDWDEFISAAAQTKLKGPWNATRLMKILKSIQHLVHSS